LFTGFQDFEDFRTDFRDSMDLKDFKDVNFPDGFRPDFKAFRSGFMDFSESVIVNVSSWFL